MKHLGLTETLIWFFYLTIILHLIDQQLIHLKNKSHLNLQLNWLVAALIEALNNILSCNEFLLRLTYYWHMYSNFSHCLGYLAKTSQFWITGIHGIGWHHARKPYEPTVSRGRSLSRIGSPLIGSGERRQLVLTFLLWVNPDKINQKPRHSLSLSLWVSVHKPIESLHSGFAAELNYPPTQSVAESKKPLLPATPAGAM